MVIINRGRLVAQGKTEDLRRELLPNSVFKLTSNTPLAQLLEICLQIESAAKIEVQENLVDGWNRYRIEIPTQSASRENLATHLIKAGVSIREIAEEHYGLEDIFLAATRRTTHDGLRN